MSAVIETKNLTKYYGKARGILDVSLSVEEGEIFGFIGPNGAGKSTTIRTLLSLIHKTSGEARIFGLDCEADHVKILEDVGYLPSEVFYYDRMRAIDLFRYSASFYQRDCSQRIQELSALLQVNLQQKIEDMSLGNKKKVGIIQGLLHSPRLIILDEPTSGLDPLMQKTFFDLIREENRRGATVLFSSHILSEVQRICDRVAIIKEGRIAAVDVLCFKEHFNRRIQTRKHTRNTDAVHYVSGKTRYAFRNDKINFARFAVLNHSVEVISVPERSSTYAFICVDFHQVPIRISINHVCVIVSLEFI